MSARVGWAARFVGAAAMALLLYLPSFSGGFLSDDLLYIQNNEVLRRSFAGALEGILTHGTMGNWSPVHHALLYLEWQLFGEVALGYRVANVLLHAAAAVALAAAARRAGLGRGAADLAGLLFLVHPVAAEPVCWISQSKTSLALALGLLALERWLAQLASPSRGRWAAASALGALALLAKPALLPLPALLGLAAWLCGGSRARRLLELTPLAVFAAGVLALNLVTQSVQGGVAPWFGGSPAATARVVPWLMWRYVRLSLLPYDLVYGVHPDPVAGWTDARFGLPLLALLAVGAGLFAAARGRPRRAFAVAWFGAMLLPVLQLVPMINLFADRYLYVALPGALVLLAEPLARGRAAQRVWVRRSSETAIVVALVALAALSVGRARRWADPEALYGEAARAYPQGRIGWTGLGAERHRRGDLSGAAAHYLRALQAAPDDPHVRQLLGRVRLRQGRRGEALRLFEESLRLDPDQRDAPWLRRQVRRLRARAQPAQ